MPTNEPERLWTILEILQWTINFFKEKQIEPARLTAEVLLAHVLKKDRLHLYVNHDQPLTPGEREAFKALIRLRVQGTPTQYLTGRQEFWSMEFVVAPGVLIPRPETEHLVEATIERAKTLEHPAIVDIGTGSGAIAISLHKELPQAAISASDISETALNIARRNAETLFPNGHRITFVQGDLFAPFVGQSFDLIVSNPPYLSAQEYAELAQEIREHEPLNAIWGGEDGLDAYRRLIAEAANYARPSGWLLLEIGNTQAEAVTQLCQENGWTVEQVIKDYAGLDRVVVATR